MTRIPSDSDITRKVHVVEFRPRDLVESSSEPHLVFGPNVDKPLPAERRREDEETRRITRRT